MNKLYEYRFYEAYYFYSKKEQPTNTLCLKGYKSNGYSKQKPISLSPLVFVDFILIFVTDKTQKLWFLQHYIIIILTYLR